MAEAVNPGVDSYSSVQLGREALQAYLYAEAAILTRGIRDLSGGVDEDQGSGNVTLLHHLGAAAQSLVRSSKTIPVDLMLDSLQARQDNSLEPPLKIQDLRTRDTTHATSPPPPVSERKPLPFSLRNELASSSHQLFVVQQKNSQIAAYLAPPKKGRVNPLTDLSDERGRLLVEQFAKLNKTQRRVMTYSMFFKLSPEQIAVTVQLTPQLVKDTIRSAKLAAPNITRGFRTQRLPKPAVPAVAPDKSTVQYYPQTPQTDKFEIGGENMSAYSLVLSSEPHTTIFWEGIDELDDEPSKLHDKKVRLLKFDFDGSTVNINSPREQPIAQSTKCAILASLGLSNKELGDFLYITEDTVKTHIRQFYEAHCIDSRVGLAKFFFTNGFFNVHSETEVELPDYNTREQEILLLLADGMSNREIGSSLFLAEDTVKTYLRSSMTKSRLRTREKLALSLFIRGQIEPVSRSNHDMRLLLRSAINSDTVTRYGRGPRRS